MLGQAEHDVEVLHGLARGALHQVVDDADHHEAAGAFVDVKITGYQDYDLLALPKGEKPAEFKVAKQAQ